MLQHLPAELQNAVIEELGYIDSIKLSQTNKHFHSITQPHKISAEVKAKEIHKAERWDKHHRVYVAQEFEREDFPGPLVYSYGVACFHCYTIRDRSHFARNQLKHMGVKRNPLLQHLNYTRSCIDCALNRGVYRSGTLLNIIKQLKYDENDPKPIEPPTVISLVLCAHCEEAHTFVSTGPPQICTTCEGAEVKIDSAEQGRHSMATQKRQYWTAECQGCHGLNGIKIPENKLRCESCNTAICKKCYGPILYWSCDCYETGDPLIGLKRLFSDEKEVEAVDDDGDVFDEDESAMLTLLDLEQ